MDFTGENSARLPRIFDAFGFGMLVLAAVLWAFFPSILDRELTINPEILAAAQSFSVLLAVAATFLTYVVGVIVYLFGYSVRNHFGPRELSSAFLLAKSVVSPSERIWYFFNQSNQRLVFLDTALGSFMIILSLCVINFFGHGYSVKQWYVASFSLMAFGVSWLMARVCVLEIALVLDAHKENESKEHLK
jgi:hypothetical protein